MNELTVRIYNESCDLLLQAAQMIPIFLNEIIARMIKYFKTQPQEDHSLKQLWISYEPFSNPTAKRILAIAHGTFCLADFGDATIRGFITDV